MRFDPRMVDRLTLVELQTCIKAYARSKGAKDDAIPSQDDNQTALSRAIADGSHRMT